ncbi:hypothetical protein QR77_09515 [Streptomyces sp. 150FB]|uniref:hypothetical protein n=1 Tax=Streptomyces sp. 150FB TaxID=1576605 RepID=UPI0005893AB1|nr:hypothetical protein [Streptomyces sp. 150FB]KIF74163.1 hypothetical protein QR77_09515 [Streptomyces sp. 150FB]
MNVKSQHYAIVVVDIEKFGSRADRVAQWLRTRLYEMAETALDDTGVDRAAAPPPADRGDGFFWLLPGSVDKTDLTARFVGLLHDQLRAHARTSNDEGALRIRVALHSGDVSWDGRGWVGEELNTACRLVDIEPLRTTLAEARRSGLALAVSDDWYRRVVHRGAPEVEREAFREFPFDAKEIQGASAWIRVPGYDVPPGITPLVRTPGQGQGQEPGPDRGAARQAGPAAATERGLPPAFAGDIGQFVYGDQTVTGGMTIQMPGNGEREK